MRSARLPTTALAAAQTPPAWRQERGANLTRVSSSVQRSRKAPAAAAEGCLAATKTNRPHRLRALRRLAVVLSNR